MTENLPYLECSSKYFVCIYFLGKFQVVVDESTLYKHLIYFFGYHFLVVENRNYN